MFATLFRAAGTFFLSYACSFEERCVLVIFYILGQYLDNICQCTYLPTNVIWYCVLYGTAYLPGQLAAD